MASILESKKNESYFLYADNMSRLVVVSNRLPRLSSNSRRRVSGLAVALSAALERSGGVWFGWNGNITSNEGDVSLRRFRKNNITFISQDISLDDFKNYYEGFVNRTLWPIFHYRLDLAQFNRDWYEAYRAVNRRFAQALVDYIHRDDLIWVQDIHLIPLAEELRSLGYQGRAGFFLHTSFPSKELIEVLPWNRNIMATTGAYDVIAFQTEADRLRFRRYLANVNLGRIEEGYTVIGGKRLVDSVIPVGINTKEFSKRAVSADARRACRKLKETLLGRKLVISVDRLDYTKGIVERLLAYETLLREYPQQNGALVFMQISAPTREDIPEFLDLRSEIEAVSGRINGQFNQEDWTPLRYINQRFDRTTLAGFFRLANVGLVTPLHDGMNLVAKEFVAAQSEGDPGVLVLSRFAGAAETLKAALIVNPYDYDAVAQAIDTGLTMPLDERQDRWRKLMAAVDTSNINAWAERLINILSKSEI